MHCLRLARTFTGRGKLLKFEGNFHGYHDQVMYAIGTPADRLGPESSADGLSRLHRLARGVGPQFDPGAIQPHRPVRGGVSPPCS